MGIRDMYIDQNKILKVLATLNKGMYSSVNYCTARDYYLQVRLESDIILLVGKNSVFGNFSNQKTFSKIVALIE